MHRSSERQFKPRRIKSVVPFQKWPVEGKTASRPLSVPLEIRTAVYGRRRIGVTSSRPDHRFSFPAIFFPTAVLRPSNLPDKFVFRRGSEDLDPPPRARSDGALQPADWVKLGSDLPASASRGWWAPALFRSRIRSQVRHSGLTIRTVFGAERHAVRRHCSEVRIPRAWAWRIAVRTVALQTPASAATWPMVRRQRPRRATSEATTDRTAVSAIVNRAAICGGSQPEPVQRRRRSMCAGDRGREPTGFLGAAGVGGTAFLAWISSASCWGVFLADRPAGKPLPHGRRQLGQPHPWRRRDGAPDFFREHIPCPSSGPFRARAKAIGENHGSPVDSCKGVAHLPHVD